MDDRNLAVNESVLDVSEYSSSNCKNKDLKFNRKDIDSIFSKLRSVAFESDIIEMDSIQKSLKEGQPLDNKSTEYIRTMYKEQYSQLFEQIEQDREDSKTLSAVIVGVIIIAIFRIAFDSSEKNVMQHAMAISSALALFLTIQQISKDILKTVNIWIEKCSIVSSEKKKFRVEIEGQHKKKCVLLWVIFVVIDIILLIFLRTDYSVIATDIYTLCTLGLTVISDGIENRVIRKYEKNIMEDEQ